MDQKRVLIISLGDIKDVICTLPLLSVLKRNDYTVEYLISEKGFEFVQDNPLINRVFLAPLEQWINKMPYLGIFEDISMVNNKLQKRNYDIAIDCQQTFRSFPFILSCGAKRRLSYSTAKGFSSFGANEFIDKGELRNNTIHYVEKNLNFARHLSLDTSKPEFCLPEIKYSSKQTMDRFLKRKEEPIILLAPDIIKGNSSWSPKNWVNLAGNLPEKYIVAVVGNEYDSNLANKMAHPNIRNLCSRTNINDLRYVLSISDIVISNNIEVSAIAWAMKKKTVITISTNESPALYNPYDIEENGNNYITEIGNLPCQPCNNNSCENSDYKCTHFPNTETILQYVRKLSKKEEQ